MTHPRRLLAAGAVCVALVAAPAASAVAAIPGGPAVRDAYDVFTIGDSYASGEGAPDVDGVYNDDGDVIAGQFEDWDTRFDGPPSVPGANQESTRCHRSGHTSPSAVATAALQSEFPDVLVKWLSMACSGASIVETGVFNGPVPPFKGGVLKRYNGVETMAKRGISAVNLRPREYPPQLERVDAHSAEAPDALLMNVGGNDVGFAELISQCLNILNLGDCHTNADLQEFITTKLAVLGDRLDRLALALRGTPEEDSGDPGLRFPPREVFLTQAPNPLRPNANSFCHAAPLGNYEGNLTANESQWLENNVVEPLNDRFATAAEDHDWELVSAHVSQFVGHALCSPSPSNWINQNLQALRKQGELDQTEGLPLAVSAGIVHPNAAGYAAIGSALHVAMRPFVVDRYTPDAAPRTTTSPTAANFGVGVSDVQLERLASGYWHRLRLRRLNDDGTVTDVAAPDRVRDLPYGAAASLYARTGRYFVTSRACGPLSRNGMIGCGPPSASLPVSTFVPAAPVGLSANGEAPPGVLFPSAGITVKWQHASALSSHDTRRSIVRLVSGATVIEQVVPGPFSSTRVYGLNDGNSYSITVRACNGPSNQTPASPDRCSRALGPVVETADRGESPLADESDLQAIEFALEGVPCSTVPVPFDPGIGPSAPGFEDFTPTFRPSCPGEPPVGRLRLTRRVISARAGRAAPVDLRWHTPGSWRELHEVSVQFVGPRGVLATLRFDQDANRFTLSRGSGRRGGRSRPAGRAGSLSVANVRVRLRADAVRGSGPAGADVRLRFAVSLPRSAGARVGIAVGAADDAGTQQPPVAAGQIRIAGSSAAARASR